MTKTYSPDAIKRMSFAKLCATLVDLQDAEDALDAIKVSERDDEWVVVMASCRSVQDHVLSAMSDKGTNTGREHRAVVGDTEWAVTSDGNILRRTGWSANTYSYEIEFGTSQGLVTRTLAFDRPLKVVRSKDDAYNLSMVLEQGFAQGMPSINGYALVKPDWHGFCIHVASCNQLVHTGEQVEWIYAHRIFLNDWIRTRVKAL